VKMPVPKLAGSGVIGCESLLNAQRLWSVYEMIEYVGFGIPRFDRNEEGRTKSNPAPRH